jgi:hypothetical protein
MESSAGGAAMREEEVMSERVGRRVLLAARPVGEPRDEDFRIETVPVREPEEAEMLLRVLWLSIDPYMRGRMNATQSYAPPIPLGGVMVGGTVSQVLRSHIPRFQPGDIVASYHGWQAYAIARASEEGLVAVEPALAPIQTALGVLGMPGQTAYFGLLRVGKPRPGETVVVSSAAGAVGSAVGQLARIYGCRAVGIAGGPEKCGWVRDTLGFDACVDYKSDDFRSQLAHACPNGIDVYFENVGGAVLDAVIPLLREGARVPVCGFISMYNDTAIDLGKSPLGVLASLPRPPEHRFFLVSEWVGEYPAAVREMASYVRDGRLKYREDIVAGLEHAPHALRRLLRGENMGKQLVHVADPV